MKYISSSAHAFFLCIPCWLVWQGYFYIATLRNNHYTSTPFCKLFKPSAQHPLRFLPQIKSTYKRRVLIVPNTIQECIGSLTLLCNGSRKLVPSCNQSDANRRQALLNHICVKVFICSHFLLLICSFFYFPCSNWLVCLHLLWF